MIESEWIPCKTCGNPTTFLGIKLCNGCWEVETRLQSYLTNENAIRFVLKALDTIKATPVEPKHGREPEKVKPLAQYLAEYINHEYVTGELIGSNKTWQEFMGQALDAYESTQGVQIRIEKVL